MYMYMYMYIEGKRERESMCVLVRERGNIYIPIVYMDDKF